MLLNIPRITPTPITTEALDTTLLNVDMDGAMAARPKKAVNNKACNTPSSEDRIDQLQDQDVVFGRGGFTYSHKGNRLFRRLVQHNHELYHSTNNAFHRQAVAQSIVNAIQRTGGRFVKKASSTSGSKRSSSWVSVQEKDACLKTCQALRDANIRATKKNSSNEDNAEKDNGVGSSSQSPQPLETNHRHQQHSQVIPNDDIVIRSEDVDEDLIDAETAAALVQSLVTTTNVSSTEPEEQQQPLSCNYGSSPYRSSFHLDIAQQSLEDQNQNNPQQTEQMADCISNSYSRFDHKLKMFQSGQSFSIPSVLSLHQQSASIIQEIQEEFLSPTAQQSSGNGGAGDVDKCSLYLDQQQSLSNDINAANFNNTNNSGMFKRGWSSVTSTSIAEALLLNEFDFE